jgi:hypothetical protein
MLFNLCAHEGRSSNAYKFFHVSCPVRSDDIGFGDLPNAQVIELRAIAGRGKVILAKFARHLPRPGSD